MSTEVKCIQCYQPDMPFINYYIFESSQCISVYHSPTEFETEIISIKEANKRIKRFDLLMTKGKPD